MKPNKLELSSVDGIQLNLEALYQIAPSCFTEVKDDKTGELRHVVNFKTLRQLLGDNAVEDADEMYQFTWPGKQEARREAARPTTKTLRPVVEDSVDWDNTQNLYIEGDNLEVLKLLQKSYMGKVKMIYIDPPYNTGNDFVYDDDFAASQDDYDLFAGNIDELGNRYRKNTETNGRYSNPDNDPRGVWSSSDISVGPAIQENVYTITTPSGREVEPPAGRSWSLSRSFPRETPR